MNFNPPAPGPDAMIAMVSAAVDYAPGMMIALGLIALYQAIAVMVDYWPLSQRETPLPMVEMFSPYGRIVVLHLSIFAGAFFMAAMGDPMIGMLALILLRVAFSVIGRSWRDNLEADATPFGTPKTNDISSSKNADFKWPYDDK